LNRFDRLVTFGDDGGLRAVGIEAIQVNVGLRCNQRCRHCHVRASPSRAEVMAWPTMERVVRVCRAARCKSVDITGGAPELNPQFRRFIAALCAEEFRVQVRTNLTVLLEPGMEDLPAFYRDNAVQLAASMPCYLEENVRAQRGEGVYEKSISVLRRLNAVEYGVNPHLALALVYNPAGPFLPPEQGALEADYRRELLARHGVTFTKLLTITNMPIGRFMAVLRREGKSTEYMRTLREAFNPATVDGLMCRRQISVGWDGVLYDCDFNLATRTPMDHGAPDHIRDFDAAKIARRRIVTRGYCFGCTAGFGSSCSGALAR
jgi:radical SAM/Cys-rich protein